MKLDIKVTNLGRLETGDIRIRPITLLTGPNGTGKSFLTKSLYSILNVINTNVYHMDLLRIITRSKILFDTFKTRITYPAHNDYQKMDYLKSALDNLKLDLNDATELELEGYFDFAKSRIEIIDKITIYYESYISSLNKTPQKKKSVKALSASIINTLNSLKEKMNDGKRNYIASLASSLSSELKDNFQITDLSQLVTFGNSTARLDIDELVHIEFGKSNIGFSLQHDFINKISSLSRVVFFESPAYWKVRDALIAAKDNANTPFFLHEKSNDVLTGVPKYFYDLDQALKTNLKDRNLGKLEESIQMLEKELGGEFTFRGDELVFKEFKTDKEIAKNLISFGMTNLGLIHALLKNNVITPGSFVFIDEPETNLHPDWQVLLMDTLIVLAENNINIVIATHSIDMMKALEAGITSQNNMNDLLSVHYLDTDGKLLEFESDNPLEQLIEARNELCSSYESLYFKSHDI